MSRAGRWYRRHGYDWQLYFARRRAAVWLHSARTPIALGLAIGATLYVIGAV